MEYKTNEIITGTISGIQSYGVFINIDTGSAFCHISNLSNKFISNISEEYTIGQSVKAKIIKIDENNRIEVSFKAVNDSEIASTHPEQPLKAQKQPKNEFIYKSNINSSSNDKSSFETMLSNFMKASDDKQKSIISRNIKRKKH